MSASIEAALDQQLRRLAEILGQENAALQEMNFAAAGTLLAEKQLCADAIAAAFRQAEGEPKLDPALLKQLSSLAATNRQSLKRALRVQRRVLELVAAAARNARPAQAYGSNGAPRSAKAGGGTLLTRV